MQPGLASAAKLLPFKGSRASVQVVCGNPWCGFRWMARACVVESTCQALDQCRRGKRAVGRPAARRARTGIGCPRSGSEPGDARYDLRRVHRLHPVRPSATTSTAARTRPRPVDPARHPIECDGGDLAKRLRIGAIPNPLLTMRNSRTSPLTPATRVAWPSTPTFVSRGSRPWRTDTRTRCSADATIRGRGRL